MQNRRTSSGSAYLKYLIEIPPSTRPELTLRRHVREVLETATNSVAWNIYRTVPGENVRVPGGIEVFNAFKSPEKEARSIVVKASAIIRWQIVR